MKIEFQNSAIIVLRHILNLVYLSPYLGLRRIYVIYFSFSSSFPLYLIIQPHLNRRIYFLYFFLEYLLLFMDNNVV